MIDKWTDEFANDLEIKMNDLLKELFDSLKDLVYV